MPLKYAPSPGTILKCNFQNFKSPEMTKERPVIVLSPRLENCSRTTFLFVPLSTTEPMIVHDYHLKLELPGRELPKGLMRECWLKGDMIYSLSLNRFELYQFRRSKDTGKRAYYTERFSREKLLEIRKAVTCAIGLK